MARRRLSTRPSPAAAPTAPRPPAPALTPGPAGARRALLLSVALALVTTAVFWPATDAQFVNYDDLDYVLQNHPIHHGLTAESIAWAFSTTHAANWHPLTWLSHMADVSLFGLEPWGHHLTSVVLHALSAGLLLLVLHRMTGRLWLAVLVAALFALHPLRVESVAWISERKDVLSAMLFFLALGAYTLYVERPSAMRYTAVLLAFVLGLMAKPMLVTLPFLLLLLDYWPFGRIACSPGGKPLWWRGDTSLGAAGRLSPGGPGKPNANNSCPVCPPPGRPILEKMPFFVLSIAAALLTYHVQQSAGAVVSDSALPLAARFNGAALAYVAYLAKTVWPAGLSILYLRPETPPAWQIALAAAALVAVSAVAVRFARRVPWLPVGWFWYLGALVPVIGLVQVGDQAFADRYTYIPLVGIFIILAFGADRLLAARPRLRPAVAVAAALAVVACVLVTHRQIAVWQSSITLWTQALRIDPGNAVAMTNLGEALAAQDRIDEAIDLHRRALDINPRLPHAWNNLGVALRRRGDVAEAIRCWQHALNIDPRHAEIEQNLGAALLALNAPAQAEPHFRRALALRPRFVAPLHGLADSLLLQLKLPEARRCYEELIAREDPDEPEVLNDLAWLLATAPDPALRDGPQAVFLATRACRLDTDNDPLLLDTLAVAYAETGRFDLALETQARALQLARDKATPAVVESLEEHMTQFKAGRPIRMTPAATDVPRPGSSTNMSPR